MPERELLGPCSICGKPVYEDDDPTFKDAWDEIPPRTEPAHTVCAENAADGIINDWREQLGIDRID